MAVEPQTQTADAEQRRDEPIIAGPARVRDEDLEPHAGLRYVAKLFKALAVLLVIMLAAEVIIGIQQEGTAALATLLVEATRIIVFAGLLWGSGDLALMLIESNHDLRATRILVGRLAYRIQKLLEQQGVAPEPDAQRGPPPDVPPQVP
jgi:hypothetical protein